MSQSGPDINLNSRKDKSPAEDIPVTGTDSIIEVIRNPRYLKQWLENLDAPNLDRTRQVTGNEHHHTVGENIRRNMGLREWASVMAELEETPHPASGVTPHSILQHPRALLDNIIHISEIDKFRLEHEDFSGLPPARKRVFQYLVDDDTPVAPDDLEAVGGTDALVWGPMGRGKTTVVQTILARMMEVSNDAVVWRGTEQRTEWLPFAPWTIVALPEGVDYEVSVAPPEEDAGFQGDVSFDPLVIDLEDIVWKVKRYSNLEDLNQNVLEPGGFHVVYPDPLHRGAEAATSQAVESGDLEYIPAGAGDDDNPPTPPKMWWFAWLIHHNSFGRNMRVTWVCDEASNLFEDHASNDNHDLEKRIAAVSSSYVDFRRNGLSFILLSQRAEEIAWQIRKKMRWGVPLSGTSNPVSEELIGAGTPPMNVDLTTNWEIGKAIIYTAGAYTEFDFDAIPTRYQVPGKLRVRAKGVAMDA
jgi:hypothetical protein